MYMDRNNYDQARMSMNFIDFIVEPLLTTLKELLPNVEPCLSNLYHNRHKWTQIDEENKALQPQPPLQNANNVVIAARVNELPAPANERPAIRPTSAPT